MGAVIHVVVFHPLTQGAAPNVIAAPYDFYLEAGGGDEGGDDVRAFVPIAPYVDAASAAFVARGNAEVSGVNTTISPIFTPNTKFVV
jgi:hypothetical protein